MLQTADSFPTGESKNGSQMPAFTPLLQDGTAVLNGSGEKFTIAELEMYSNDPFWKNLRLPFLWEFTLWYIKKRINSFLNP